jgi:hypothetical protein
MFSCQELLKFLTPSADNVNQIKRSSPRTASPHSRSSLSLSPNRTRDSHSGSTSRKTPHLPDQLGLQPSTPGVGLWNTSWQRSLRSDSPSGDNLSPSVSGTAWIPLEAAHTHAESAKSETSIPASTSASHRSRRAPRDILTAEANAAVEAEFRMMAHARHFINAEADALHKEVCV